MIHLELVNFSEMFSLLTDPPIIANDVSCNTTADKNDLNRLLYTQYHGDTLSVLPTCDCGNIKGGYRIGERCTDCNTTCENPVERTLESALWMRVPKGVNAFINPTMWVILKRRLTSNNWSVLDFLTDKYYTPPNAQQPVWVRKIIKAEIPIGLNSFIENFDKIIQLLFCDGRSYEELIHSVEVQGIQNDWYGIVKMIHMYRHCIFTPYLPLPSRVGFVVESNETGNYADETFTNALNAMYTVMHVDNSVRKMSISGKESRTVKALHQLAEFYETFAKETLSKKPGILRKHIFGIRLHFTARAVITSITAPHSYDELHAPWSVGIQLMRMHLLNKLYKLGYSHRQADMFLREHTYKYHPLIDQLFKQLISETPYAGIPVIFQRNPSLARGSAQLLYITKFKTDTNDNTFSLSVKILVGFNADFDGDELNLMLILDKEMHDALYPLAPHMSSLDVTRPRKLSVNLKIQPPVAATIDNWLNHGLAAHDGIINYA